MLDYTKELNDNPYLILPLDSFLASCHSHLFLLSQMPTSSLNKGMRTFLMFCWKGEKEPLISSWC